MNAGRGMDDQSGGLVYNDECFVFVDDLDRDRFRSEVGCSRGDQLDFEFVVFAQLVGRLGRLAVDENVFGFDETLEPRATPAVNARG